MSRPFLCDCGRLIDVSEIDPGGEFRCPHCELDRRLDLADPALLSNSETDGVYDILLRRKMAEEAEIAAAVPALAAAGRSRAPSPPPPPRALAPTETAAIDAPPSASPAGLATGDELGPFRLVGFLGQGGMATVYEAFDTSLHRTVALKVLAKEHASNEELIDRFRREARAAGALTHPNITHIYSIGEDRGYYYFAMELVRGRTLASFIEQEERLPEDAAIDYLLQIARGMRAAKQKKIIHRDIKPSNLILSEDGLIKITDFGLAKVITSPIDITATGVIIGTPLYMSPEQGRGEPLDHRSDIYSLGCSFYHLLCGEPPFSGESAMNIIVGHITKSPPPLESRLQEISSRLASIVRKMMEKVPLDRFQDYNSLIEAVTEMSTATPTPLSTRLERAHGRIVLISEQSEERVPADPMSLKQLSVADVNLELGRHEKALSLYRRVLEDHPELELDLSFRMLKIFQEQEDEENLQALYRRILELSDEPRERFFCRWKLLMRSYQAFQDEVKDSRQILDEILSEEIPSGVPEKRLRQRRDDLEELEKKLRRERESGVMLIRKTGDLQIELD